jgi:predicted PurR-regulated permease PerM
MPITLRDSRALWVLAFLGIVAALYFARAVFIPLAVAILLTFVLAPPARLLRRWGLPRVPAALIVVVVAFVFILGLAGLLGQQLTQLAGDLPQYQYTITQKIENIRNAMASGGTLQRISQFLSQVNQEISPNQSNQTSPSSAEQQKPAPVQIIPASPRPTEVIQRIVEPLVDPLTTLGLILLFVIFFLLDRESLRDRMIRLAGLHDLHGTTQLMDDGARRLSRYFLAQTSINALFGLIVGVGLTLIGVPNPILWGILAMLLRFVPYLGAWIAAAFPIAVSFAVDPGWTKTLLTAGLFVVTEPIIGQFIEPYIYGHTTGLTPVAVVISATFWTWLWGPIGLLLSTPLAVCLGVLGRHIESLEFLEVMIGDEPPLSPSQTFYQRALSGSENEALDQLEQCLRQGQDLTECYQHIVVEALLLAEIDHHRGVLDDEHAETINNVVRSLLAEIADEQDTDRSRQSPGARSRPEKEQTTPAPPPATAPQERPVLCISGPGRFDHTIALILAQLLGRAGIRVRLEADAAISPLNIAGLDVTAAEVVCLSYLHLGHSPAHLRFSIRRLRRRIPSATIVACLWGYEESEVPQSDLKGAGADTFALTLADTVALCANAVPATKAEPSAVEDARGQVDAA